MSVSTKGVIATPTKNVALAAGLACELLDKVSRLLRKSYVELHPAENLPLRLMELFSSSHDLVFRPVNSFGVMSVNLFGNVRTPYLFFACDSDNLDISPRSISMSLGSNPEGVALMELLLMAMSPLGTPFLRKNDSLDEEGFERQSHLEGVTLLEMLGAGLLGPTNFSLHLHNLAEDARLDHDKVSGLDEATRHSLSLAGGRTYKDTQKAIEDLRLAAASTPRATALQERLSQLLDALREIGLQQLETKQKLAA